MNLDYESEFYHRVLLESKEKLEYLQSRGVTLEMAELFQLGYCMRRDRMLRNRLTIPIRDTAGKIVSIAGRSLSEETPVYTHYPFSKSKHLYGLYLTKSDIQKCGSCILVEGFFDFFTLFRYGFRNVVCLMGKTLTEDQAWLLSKYVSNAILVLDGDEAGQKAQHRLLDSTLLNEILHLQGVFLPDGLDPDEYLQKYGSERFEQLLSKRSGRQSTLAKVLSRIKELQRVESVL